jgi:hypothetical protein
MNDGFENNWEAKLTKETDTVLFWEKPFLPPIPVSMNEENVTQYIKRISPSLRRSKNKWLTIIDTVLRGSILFVVPTILAFWLWIDLDGRELVLFLTGDCNGDCEAFSAVGAVQGLFFTLVLYYTTAWVVSKSSVTIKSRLYFLRRDK